MLLLHKIAIYCIILTVFSVNCKCDKNTDLAELLKEEQEKTNLVKNCFFDEKLWHKFESEGINLKTLQEDMKSVNEKQDWEALLGIEISNLIPLEKIKEEGNEVAIESWTKAINDYFLPAAEIHNALIDERNRIAPNCFHPSDVRMKLQKSALKTFFPYRHLFRLVLGNDQAFIEKASVEKFKQFCYAYLALLENLKKQLTAKNLD